MMILFGQCIIFVKSLFLPTTVVVSKTHLVGKKNIKCKYQICENENLKKDKVIHKNLVIEF
jgi:hypothetical protein